MHTGVDKNPNSNFSEIYSIWDREKNLELLLEKISDLIIPGATIKSPEYVNDIDTGTLREVDVGIRLNTEKGSVFIAIECRDRGGVQDIQWIEQLISKNKVYRQIF